MTTQCEFDFNSMKVAKANRPHHRTTIITTDNDSYEMVAKLRDGEEVNIPLVNDIISSASGGSSVIHHPIRRVRLLRRQLAGNFRRVKVRSEKDRTINCIIVGDIWGKDDSCFARVTVSKQPICNRKVCDTIA